ncbi:MAG: TolC family protein [Prevotella sp.]|nr:TolC family protein [Prevotella sp.]
MDKRCFSLLLAVMLCTAKVSAQFNESGISAGFFDSSDESTINFSKFHLPPLAILLENAKSNPQILSLAKAQELAKAEMNKQKRHIFSYINGHGSYSYGKADMWGNSSSTYNNMIYQFQGSEQNYWNVGVSVNLPLEDILDLGASVKRKRMEMEQARLAKDVAYEQLKLQIATLYVNITNNLVALKTAGENAAVYQGAGQLTQVQFQQGDLSVGAFAETKQREEQAVSNFQALQTKITVDIITLEILSRTPILTNTTTEITLDDEPKSAKDIARENKQAEKRMKKAAKEGAKRERELLKADEKAKKELEKQAKKEEEAAKEKAEENN